MEDTRLAQGIWSILLQLSIVSTLYRSAEYLEEFVRSCEDSVSQVASNYEIVLVDDGSPDNSLAIARELARSRPHLKVVELSRNFGHHAAIMAGLGHSCGDIVFFVDSDLEERPELLVRFHEILVETSSDVVYGVHDQSTGGFARRVTSGLFWRVFNFLSDTQIEPNLCHVRLMRRSYVDALLSLPEVNLFLGGLYAWPGFKQIGVRIERKLNRSQSTYTPIRRLSLFANSLTAFSSRPLLFLFFSGALISVFAFLIGVYFTVLRLANPDAVVSGFTFVIVAIALFGGFIIASLGVIGVYVARLFEEIKGRPRYIVRSVTQGPEDRLG